MTFAEESVLEISERYQKTFSHVSLNELEVSYIDESVLYFTNILKKLEKIYSVAVLNANNYQDFAIHLNSAFKTLNQVGLFLAGQEKTVQLREECINPYGILKDWVIGEIFDVKGILYAIKSRARMTKIVQRLFDLEDNQLSSYEKICTGKVGIFQKLAGKGEEQVKEVALNNLMKTRHELEMAKLTLKIIDCRLTKIELPFFRKSKKHQFNTVFKAFIKANVDELESLMEQSKHVLFIHSNM
jgi:hypothetical protein